MAVVSPLGMWLIKVWFFASTFVVNPDSYREANFLNPENVTCHLSETIIGEINLEE